MRQQFAKHFSKNPDGSWTCTSHATLASPKGRIQVTEGSRFYRGTHFMGFDLARWLDEQLDQTLGSHVRAVTRPSDNDPKARSA